MERYRTESPKGEFVLIIEGQSENVLIENERDKFSEISIEEHMNMYLEKGMPKKEAIKKVAEDRGMNKRDVYNIVMVKEK
jgi:16S rRNA (cytidine1402-2'-O)-methyltransferase